EAEAQRLPARDPRAGDRRSRVPDAGGGPARQRLRAVDAGGDAGRRGGDGSRARREGVAPGEGGGRGEACVASEGPKRKEDSIPALQRKRFEAGLAKLREGLSIKGRMKRRDRIPESVGRLREKHSKVARHYSVEVVGDDRGADADEASGSCVLRTSRTGWGAEAILRARWRLSEIEATFRSLKSELGSGPA
ncbi:MAG: hypothetical protein OXI01_24700, partial [Albidovulum sp.]|nr:hypothetical protein [Albidovulum sp.]